MNLKIYRPLNNSLRNKKLVNKNIMPITKFKNLYKIVRKQNGKNCRGGYTINSKGGSNFNFYREVDWKRIKFNTTATLVGLDFDNYRTAFLGLIKYINGAYSYILLNDKKDLHGTIQTSLTYTNSIENLNWSIPLYKLPAGLLISNIEFKPGLGGGLVRAAGTAAKIMRIQDNGNYLIHLPSKKYLSVSPYTMVSVGRVSNPWHKFEHWSKAGQSYLYNRRPEVRGEAMNAVDHPHGGRTRGGIPRKNPWGRIIK